jgi:hypothetical protein
MDPAAAPEHAWTAVFKAWVWSPPRNSATDLRQRGYSNALLTVYPGGFAIRPNWLERRMFGWQFADYAWPAVVIETHTPLRSAGVLFEISGRLARCAVKHSEHERLSGTLARAGLTVIEVKHRGREAPHQVPRVTLGPRASDVPASIVED